MENLIKNLDNNKYIFKCSQCNKSLDLSDQNFYCKICKSNFCLICIKAHNEIFLDQTVIKANEDLSNNDSQKNSLLANPDFDLDDRIIHNENLKSYSTEGDTYNDINMLFHETLISLEEYFNEEICKLKAKKIKEKKETNENMNIIIDSEGDFKYNIEELKKMEPLDRLNKIMEDIKKFKK